MIGERIGNFKIVQQLGEGGMGVVYLGEHDKVGTKVAIKMLLPEISANKEVVDRFFNEAVAAGQIHHVGIAKVFDVGFLPSGRAYLIMEYLPGETLLHRIRKLGRLSVPHVAEIGKQMCAVLDAVHKAGIVHRDLKPENVFLVPDDEIGERVRLVDFGIAKLSTVGGNLTSTAFSMGTPTYMAPEQWRNSKTVDWRADAYSLGCITYEMITGLPPFSFETIGEACAKHLDEEPAPLATKVNVPQPLQNLVTALLAKQPGNRPASMRDIGLAFAQLSGLPAPAPSGPIEVPLGTDSRTVRHGPMRPADLVAPTVPQRPSDAATVPHRPSDAATVQAPHRPSDAATVQAPHQAYAAPTLPLTELPRRPTPRMIPIPQPALLTPIPTPQPAARWKLGLAALVIAGGGTAAVVMLRKTDRPRPGTDDTAEPTSSSTTEPSTRGSSGGPRPNVTEPGIGSAAVVDPSLPKEIDGTMISQTFMAVKEAVRPCGDKAVEKGIVRIIVTVDPDGSIASAVINESPDVGLGKCVAGEIMRAHFPKTQTGGTFTYPLLF